LRTSHQCSALTSSVSLHNCNALSGTLNPTNKVLASTSLSVVHGLLLALTTVRVEPVGRWYESFCSRRHHQQTLSHGSLVSSSSDDEAAELILDEEDDTQLLSSLDPKEWKVGIFYDTFVVTFWHFCLYGT